MVASASLLLAFLQTSSAPPSEIHLAYGNDPTTTMSVVWQTPTATKDPVVRFGLTSKLGTITHSKRVTYPYETKVIQEASLRNLRPGTTYFYQVGDETGGWSRVHQFQTAPKQPAVFTFTAFGDQGVSSEAEQNIRNLRTEKPLFHALLGDVSYANGKQSVWDDYLKEIEPFAAETPFMLTLGNHENEKITIDGQRVEIGYAAYLSRFALPMPENNYVFTIGNARFVAFNSDDYANPSGLDWLRDSLEAARADKSVKWVIVFQHHPPYGSSKGRGDNPGLIRTVNPIYDQYKVDLVLSGHDHHYERQFPMRAGKPTSTAKTGYKRGEGTLYMVAGGGGKGLYDFSDPQPEICAVREKTYCYLRVSVPRRGPLKIEAKRLDGSIIETIEVRG